MYSDKDPTADKDGLLSVVRTEFRKDANLPRTQTQRIESIPTLMHLPVFMQQILILHVRLQLQFSDASGSEEIRFAKDSRCEVIHSSFH